METIPLKSNISNFKYSIISQMIVIIFGIIRALIIPILLGVSDFGYWQVYLLYAGFVCIFSFGFNDGIYLRYGGKQKTDLPWSKLRGSFYLYFIALLIISLLFVVTIEYIHLTPEKSLTFYYVIVNIGLMGFSSLFLFIFQTTNQIKKYSIYMLVDKLIFLALLAYIYQYSNVGFEALMIIDCISKVILMIAMAVDCRNDLFGKVSNFLISLQEFYKNINVGIKLMLANLGSMLVLNMSRFFVEQYYTLEEFSTFSFGITLTNIFLMAMNGVAVALYPFLKRLPEQNYSQVYAELTSALSMFLFLSLFAYYPVHYFVFNYMSEYKTVLSYFNILFVLSLLQIKMNLTINTFYKVLREERALLKANFSSVVVGLLLSVFVVCFYKTVELMAFALLVTIVFRVYQSDIFINTILGSKNIGSAVLELSVFIVFIIATSTLELYMSFVMTFLFMITYVYIQKNNIKKWLDIVKGKE